LSLSSLDKSELLEYLDQYESANSDDVARALNVTYSVAAMALLRLVRQDLVTRYKHPEHHVYVYELTPKGEARLAYLLETEFDDD